LIDAEIYDEISAISGMKGEVVLDDRAVRPGFKMNDAALIGYLFVPLYFLLARILL
jgi:hypothetical protein